MLCGTSGTELQTILDLSKSVQSFSSTDGAVKSKSVNDTLGKVGCSDEWCELFVEAEGRSCCHATTHGRKLGMSNEARFRFPSRAPAIIFKSLTVKAKSIFWKIFDVRDVTDVTVFRKRDNQIRCFSYGSKLLYVIVAASRPQSANTINYTSPPPAQINAFLV